MKKTFTTIVALAMRMGAIAQTLSTGGQFMDLLLPMEGSVAATASDWGTTAGSNDNPKYAGTWDGTLGRWKDNGVEDTERSYWGGNIIKGDDGKFHIYVSGWPESTERGHMAWSSASRVYHVSSDNVWGPYTYISDIGPGHNSEIYKTGDTYVIYHIEPLGIYTSTTLGDTWTSGEFLYDKRDRILIAGEKTETSLSNCSFAKREDGSFVMIDRGGGIWVSRDGLTDPWHQLTDKSVYLNSEVKNRGYLEDPVIWRDHLQYHMIVNDWNARYAYYYRSLSGDQIVTKYANQPQDNGNNWMLEPVSGATASLSLNDVTNGLQALVTSAGAEDIRLDYTATVTSAGFGTLVVPFEADVTGDVQAWELTAMEGSAIQGNQVTTILANQPVLLKNEGTLSLSAKSGTIAYEASPTNGLLHGTYAQTTVEADNYVLQKQGDDVAFFLVQSGSEPTIKPFRAYLSAPVGARRLTFAFDESTGIHDVKDGESTLPNAPFGSAAWLAQHPSSLYDLQGRRMNPAISRSASSHGSSADVPSSPLKRGLYISNGKKMMVK